jgi:DNA-binding NarL/FixJ family response regulator
MGNDDDDRFARHGHGGADANGNGDAIPAPPAIVAPPADVDSRHAQIYALSEEGMSTHQIAEQLGRPEGEVELILALRPRGRAAV